MNVLLALLAAFPAFAGDDVLAVLPFEVHADEARWEDMGDGAASMLVTDLARGEGVRLVERTRIQEVLDELALQRSDFADPATARALGEGLGATGLVFGSVTVLEDHVRLDARLVDVSSGESVLAQQAEGDAERFFTLERTLALRLLVHLGASLDPETLAYLQAEEPDRGGARPARPAPPSDTPRARLTLKKGVGHTWIFVDGQAQGEHRRRAPLPPIEIGVGKHELAISVDPDGIALRCLGVVDVGPEGLVVKGGLVPCKDLDAEAEPPWTSIRRDGLIRLEGDEASFADVTVGDVEKAYSVSVLNLPAGRHDVLLSKFVHGAPDWTCSGRIDLERQPGLDVHRRALRVTSGGCHGFDVPGVTPTIGPRSYKARIDAEQAAEREAERAERAAR